MPIAELVEAELVEAELVEAELVEAELVEGNGGFDKLSRLVMAAARAGAIKRL